MKTLYFLDAGTTWSKILKVTNGIKEYSVLKSAELKNCNFDFALTTGHCSSACKKNYENEVVALSFGIDRNKLKDETVFDLGSRDSKWIKFKNSKFSDMDWNSSCASATGATIEMLLKFYNVNMDDLQVQKEKYPVTCGIFGLEKIMEDVSCGVNPEIAISKFINGVAFSAYNFAKRPQRLFISGGFCENKCFMNSINFYTNAIPLGRFVLVDGLYNIYCENN